MDPIAAELTRAVRFVLHFRGKTPGSLRCSAIKTPGSLNTGQLALLRYKNTGQLALLRYKLKRIV